MNFFQNFFENLFMALFPFASQTFRDGFEDLIELSHVMPSFVSACFTTIAAFIIIRIAINIF